MTIEEAQAEISRLQSQVQYLMENQTGAHCTYCGHFTPAEGRTFAEWQAEVHEHITTCIQHPMAQHMHEVRQKEAAIERVQSAVSQMVQEVYDRSTDEQKLFVRDVISPLYYAIMGGFAHIRPDIQMFASQMDQVFPQMDQRMNWNQEDLDTRYEWLRDRVGELCESISETMDLPVIMLRAIRVGNAAMMLWSTGHQHAQFEQALEQIGEQERNDKMATIIGQIMEEPTDANPE